MGKSFVLGSSMPAAGVLTDGYTSPAKKRVRYVHATNTGSAAVVRVSFAPGGAVSSASQFLHYDNPLAAGESKKYVLDLDIEATDVLRVYSDTGDVTFHFVEGQD